MSATPLIEVENIKRLLQRKEKYFTYALIETEFQGWTAKAELEWRTETGELTKYWVQIHNPAEENKFRTGEINGRAEGLFGKITSFEMSFSGFGSVKLDEAQRHLDTLGVAFEIARELERRLEATGFPMPEIETLDETIYVIGEPKKEGA